MNSSGIALGRAAHSQAQKHSFAGDEPVFSFEGNRRVLLSAVKTRSPLAGPALTCTHLPRGFCSFTWPQPTKPKAWTCPALEEQHDSLSPEKDQAQGGSGATVWSPNFQQLVVAPPELSGATIVASAAKTILRFMLPPHTKNCCCGSRTNLPANVTPDLPAHKSPS